MADQERACTLGEETSMSRRVKFGAPVARMAAALVVLGVTAAAQGVLPPTNNLPNPYQTIENYFKMPEGRTWGATSAVEIDRDGRSIWVAERCGEALYRTVELILVRHLINRGACGHVFLIDGIPCFPTFLPLLFI